MGERPDGWRCPPNVPRKQRKDKVAADVTTHLPMEAPLPWPLDGGRRHDSWARRMARVTVRHHGHQPTSWSIKRARTSRCLEHVTG